MSSTFSKANWKFASQFIIRIRSIDIFPSLASPPPPSRERERERAKTRKEKKRGWTSAFPDEQNVVAG